MTEIEQLKDELERLKARLGNVENQLDAVDKSVENLWELKQHQ